MVERNPSPSAAMGPVPSAENATILRKLKEFLLSRRVPAFLVGGYIRDSLIGTPVSDADVVVQGDFLSLAKDMAGAFGATFAPLGQPHQVARVVVPLPEAGRWSIDVSPLKGSIHGDLSGRDFTVNAMALATDDWGTPEWKDRILDPFGGKADLSLGVIRAIGPSVFQEDPARLLRAVRLAAKLGFRIDPATAQLISSEASLVSSAAVERVRDELLGILSLDGAKNHLETLDELGLLCCIIPELGEGKGVEQPKEHHWDVFGHSVQSVEGVERVVSRNRDDPLTSLVPWDQETDRRFAQEVVDGHPRLVVLKLSALLHDVAKPRTKAVDAKGRTRFLGHHTLGASMSSDILHRLRLSNRGVGMVCGMVENHLRPTQMSQGAEMPTPRAVYRYFRDVEDVAIDTLYLSLADHLAARGPEIDMDSWRRHVGIVNHVLEVGTRAQSPERMPRLITGHDLILELGLSPGPRLGDLLEGVRDAQAAGEVGTREGALAWVRGRLKDLPPLGEPQLGRVADSRPMDPAG